MVEVTVRRVCLLVIGLWLFALLWGRLSMFSEVWSQEHAFAREFIATNERCVNDHGYQHDAPMTCVRASVEKDRWPLFRAVGIVFERTYLCGAIPCTDLLRAILESWSALAAIIAVSVTATCFVCSGIYKRAEQGYYTPAPALRHHENAYGINNGPAVMIAYDDPAVALQLPSSATTDYPTWRRNLAAYVPLLAGAQRQHEKLI